MATKAKVNIEVNRDDKMTLAEALSRDPHDAKFALWLVGTAPLICHAWSEKARQEMLGKQVKAARGAKEARDPADDFLSSLYFLPDNVSYGFPTMAIKASWLSMADKSKGLARSGAVGAAASIWLDTPILAKQKTAVPGAVSDLPVSRIYSPNEPQMREDPVRLAGKTASFAYRAQFWPWAIRVTGSFNPDIVSPSNLVNLVREGGRGIGIGDWRPARSGTFGTYRVALTAEMEAWDLFAAGKGPCPIETLAEAAE